MGNRKEKKGATHEGRDEREGEETGEMKEEKKTLLTLNNDTTIALCLLFFFQGIN